MNNFIIRLITFTLSIAIMRAGWFATMPFLTIYLHTNTTQNPLLIGFMMGIGWLAASIGGVFGGVLVDKTNPKKIMIFSLIFSSITLFFYSIANSKDILILIALNILIGLFIAFFEIGGKAYISSNFDEKQKLHAFNFRYTAINIGAAVGPYIGVWFSNHNPKQMFIFTALTYLIVAVFSFLILPQSKVKQVIQKPDLKTIFYNIISHKELLMLTFLSFICFLAMAQIETTLPQYMNGRVNNYTLLYATLLSINAVIVIAFQIPFGFFIERFNKIYLAYFSSVLFILSICLFAIAEIIYSSIINLFVDKVATSDMQGVYYGVANLGMLGLFLGPIIGGYFLTYFNGSVFYLLLSAVMLSSVFIYKILKNKLI